MVFEELSKYVRNPSYVQGLTSRLSVHEAIKAQLYVLGFRLGYVPILEATTSCANYNRLDCAYAKAGVVVCAIEIDYSIKKKSLEKLLSLDSNIEKIIISYGRKEAKCKAIYRYREQLQSVKHYIMNPQFDKKTYSFY